MKSSLSIENWLENLKFAPKLTTMLRMAPQYFRNSRDPAIFLREFGKFADRLPKANVIVLSAGDDHQNSERAFILAHDFFQQKGLESRLLLDDAVGDWRMLGERVLILRGKN